MTDDTLVTKYRPTQWKEVIGQDAIVRSMKAVLAKGSSRSFLFFGPSGTGKTTLARIAASVVGCGPSDVREIDAATHTGIDDMRQITQSLQFKPLGMSKARAIIVDESHRLSKNAWDSLLKPIEEPPSWIWWFLCTTNLSAVPHTIQTRCVCYTFKPVSRGELRDLLLDVAEQERIEDGFIDMCVAAAQGSPRAALRNLAACAQAKSKDDARELLRLVAEGGGAIDLARALVGKGNWETIKEIIVSLREQDQEPEGVRHVVRAYVTNVILGADKRTDVEKCFAILEAFSQPFHSGDGVSPLILACGRLLLGSD